MITEKDLETIENQLWEHQFEIDLMREIIVMPVSFQVELLCVNKKLIKALMCENDWSIKIEKQLR